MFKSLESPGRIRYHDDAPRRLRVAVLGVGAGGSKAISGMMDARLKGFEFISINTSAKALDASNAPVRLQVGAQLTHGRGAAGNADIGRRAVLEDSRIVIEAIDGADMVFITACLGGGTGTGAAPVVASLARELGALTIAVVTLPFGIEGRRRTKQAEFGLQELLDTVDSLIVIPNEKLIAAANDRFFFGSFRMADDALRHAVQGIGEIITIPGPFNRDVADVKTTLSGRGHATLGTARRSGTDRAVNAAVAAVASPLIDSGAVHAAQGMLINITGSSSLRLSEVNEAATTIRSIAHKDADIIVGAVLDESMGDEVRITLIACGLMPDHAGRTEPRVEREDLRLGRSGSRRNERASVRHPYTVEEPVARKSLEPETSGSRVPMQVPTEIAGEEVAVATPATTPQEPHGEKDIDSTASVAAISNEFSPMQNDDGFIVSAVASEPSSVRVALPEDFGAPAHTAKSTLTHYSTLHQAALAAYAAMSMPEGPEPEESPSEEPDGFAAILERRLELADEVDTRGFIPELSDDADLDDSVFLESFDEPARAGTENAKL